MFLLPMNASPLIYNVSVRRVRLAFCSGVD